MKYLINADYTVVMKGRAVSKSKLETDDFVYDTDKKELASVQMKEIASANGMKLKGKSTKDIKASFDEALSKLKLAEKRKMTESEKVSGIVKAGIEAKTSEDEILIEIVQSGIKFQAAIKMMKNAMIELGFSVSTKERYEKAKKLLEDDEFEPEEYTDVVAMAKELTKQIGGTSEAQALQQIRKYCKEFEVDMPKKVKEKKASLAVRVMTWIVSNWEAETSELEEWLEEIEAPEKAVSGWLAKFDAVKKEIAVQEKANAKAEDEDEDEEDED